MMQLTQVSQALQVMIIEVKLASQVQLTFPKNSKNTNRKNKQERSIR